MEYIIIPKGDKGYLLSYTVTKVDGTVMDLTDFTATLKVWNPGDPETLIVTGSCTLTATPTDGICNYLIAANNFAVNSVRYQAEIELTLSGVIESVRSFGIIVKESA